jgi:hypothetical protein
MTKKRILGCLRVPPVEYHWFISSLSKTSIAAHQWTAKQFWVDRQSLKQEDNVYCLE